MLQWKSSGAKCDTDPPSWLQENNIGKCVKWGRLVQPARSACVQAHQQICKVFPQQLPLPGSVLGVKDGGKSWFPKVYYLLASSATKAGVEQMAWWQHTQYWLLWACGSRQKVSSSRCHLGAPAIALWSSCSLQLSSPDSASVQPTLPCKDTIVGPQTMYLALIVLRCRQRGKFIFSAASSSSYSSC